MLSKTGFYQQHHQHRQHHYSDDHVDHEEAGWQGLADLSKYNRIPRSLSAFEERVFANLRDEHVTIEHKKAFCGCQMLVLLS